MIVIKNKEELAGMRRAGAQTGQILHEVVSKVAPGVTTAELDAYAAELSKEVDGIPAFMGITGFQVISAPR